MLTRFVYISRASAGFKPDQLVDIQRTATKTNPRLEITGFLFFVDGYFLQILEGPKAELDELLARIRQDPRHEEIEMLIEQETPTRLFADWGMGARHLSLAEFGDLAGIRDLDRHDPFQHCRDRPNIVIELFENFLESLVNRED